MGSPRRRYTTPVLMRRSSIGSRRTSPAVCKRVRGFAEGSSLGPWWARRFAASCSVRPYHCFSAGWRPVWGSIFGDVVLTTAPSGSSLFSRLQYPRGCDGAHDCTDAQNSRVTRIVRTMQKVCGVRQNLIEACLFSDTEAAEDQVENIVSGGFAGDGIEWSQGAVKIEHDHLVRNVTVSGFAGRFQTANGFQHQSLMADIGEESCLVLAAGLA